MPRSRPHARRSVLGVDAFEVANQQQSELDPGGQAGAAHRGGVEAGTLRFDEVVEAVLSQQLIQPTSRDYRVLPRRRHRPRRRLFCDKRQSARPH